MNVQKLRNYDQMVQAYRKECSDFWLKEFPVLAIITSAVIFGFFYGMSKLPGAVVPGYWWMMAILLWIPPMIALPIMYLPKKPHPEDVMRNRQLRWQHGMDTTVSSGDDDL